MLKMEDLNSTPPIDSDNDLEDDYMDCSLHDLVGNDRFYEVVESRLEDPNERDESGYTLLHAAAWSRDENSRILRLLLDRNADVYSTAQHEYTPLHFAVASRKRKAVTALLDAGASVNSKDILGRTALHFAIAKTWSYHLSSVLNPAFDLWIVKRLLSHPDIEIDPVNNAGSTPLMWAVRAQNSDAVRALLKKGADPNIPNTNNQTPLHVALSSVDPSKDIVFNLLYKGVDIYCEDRFGQTPMDLFLRHLPADDVARQVVWSIVLRHRVTESLVLELKKIPGLYKYYEKCLEEVTLMKKAIVYQNFTLHDFACNCFHFNVKDYVVEVIRPVVRILLSASYTEYSKFIFDRLFGFPC